MRERSAWLLCGLLFFTLAPPLESKRGGVSMGRTMGRGSSGARSGGLSGASKTRTNAGANPNYQRNTNIGSAGQRPQQPAGSWGSGGAAGGASGGSSWNSNNRQNPKHNAGGWSGPSHTSKYSKGSGIGSVLRSNNFKNAIVGAAAGYLTYQAGKAIIRAAAGPMMWNNRQYYWGQNYYQPRSGQTNMCRMPLDQESQFSNVYFQDQSRPREVVWGCGFGEYCCGYECCRGGGSSGYGSGISWGMIILLILVFCCFVPLTIGYCRRSGMFSSR